MTVMRSSGGQGSSPLSTLESVYRLLGVVSQQFEARLEIGLVRLPHIACDFRVIHYKPLVPSI